MSGEWIKLRVDLADDPAVIAISAATRLCADEVIGKLYRLWAWADRQTRDGCAQGVTAEWVDSFVRKRGFAAAMVRSSWLETTDDGIRFPHFERHNGESAKTRALDAKRKQVQRSSVIDPHSFRTNSGQIPDKSVTREEKRREEQKQKQTRAPKVALPPGFAISDRVRSWAADKGHTSLEARLEHFVGYARRNGARYVDWDEAFMSAIREDWAKIVDSKPQAAGTWVPSTRVAL
jgi:hypothetical protein